MNPSWLLVIGISLVPIVIARAIKRKRVAGKEEMVDDVFVDYFRGMVPPRRLDDVLSTRDLVAESLRLPPNKLAPTDSLIELRDRLCPVVSGHIAIGELFEDLESEIKGRVSDRDIDTIADFIVCYLGGRGVNEV